LKISKRVEGVEYAIRDIALSAKELEKKGKKITYLNIGDPVLYGFQPPDNVKEAFVRAIKNHTEPEIQRAALAGLILITGFACFGLSEAIFERSRPANFYSFYLAVLLAMVSSYSSGKTGKVTSRVAPD